jgi:hypothetical protein
VTFGPGAPGGGLVGGRNQLLVSLFQGVTSSSLVVDLQGSVSSEGVQVAIGTLTDSSVIVRAELGAEDDRFTLSAQGMVGSVVTADVALGPGNNMAYLAHRNLDASTTAINLQGGAIPTQVDTVYWEAAGVLTGSSRIATSALLLGGADVFRGRLYSDQLVVTAVASVDLHVGGGAGNDRLDLDDGLWAVGAPPDATTQNLGLIALALEGGAGNDTVNATLDNGVSGTGTTRLRLEGGDGDDVEVSSVRLSAASGSPTVDRVLRGGAGSDVVYVGTLQEGGPSGFLGRSLVDGGAGSDNCLSFAVGGAVDRLLLRCESGL